MARHEIYSIVANALGIPESKITEDSGMGRDPAWDSLAHVKVMLALENRFGIKINDDTVERYTSMRAVLQLVNDAE